MQSEKTLDMTKGSPLKLLVTFAIPLVLGSLFQQLYSFVDTAIIGRCISSDALTAVGITSSLNFLILGFSMGCANGFCIPIAQSIGANNPKDTSKNFWNGLYLSIFIGLLISGVFCFLIRPLLVAMHTDPALLDTASEYLTIILIGQITAVLYNYLAGVLRAFGDSKHPFQFLVISSLINVGFDFLFILTFHMGVGGAAIATVISQGISAFLCGWWLYKKTNFLHLQDTDGENLSAVSVPHMKKISKIGIPLGLEYSVCSIGNIILQSSINSLGTVIAAGQICGEKIRSIATLPMESVGTAMATYVGQNYGARKFDRIKKGIRSGICIQAVYSFCAWILLCILKKPLVYLLLGTTTSAEALAALKYLTIITVLFLFHGSLMIFRNTIQGMGYGFAALASSAMEILGRTVAGLLAVHYNSFFLICISSPLAWIFACICCICLCIYYLHKEKKNEDM